ncbi:MAG: class A beta-lactamase [Betaproteobacteria bacterium]|nr:class A beta-lactamase [Betaproteobacteria bacterium]
MGVGAHHIETGREIYVNRAERFPMGSTFKIPLAVQLLALVDQGMVSLDKPITVQTSDLRPGSGTLVKLFDESRPAWSLRQLLELMLINSDNSATDIIWKEAGGREPVMGRLASLGIRGMSVDRPTALLLAAVLGIEPPPPEAERSLARFKELIRTVSRTKRDAAAAAFFKDRRDNATPEAMVDLLVKIWRQQALSPDQSARLLDIMYRCATGRGRLRGMLPRGAKVAHKTGTLRIGVTNDVGIIPLPGGAGTVAIAIFIRESASDLSTQERTIAEIARAIYDYFVSNPVSPSVSVRSPAL